MPEDRRESRRYIMNADISAGKMSRKPDGEKAFGGVKQQRGDADGPAGRARDVGGADVSASDEADVAAARGAHQQIAERNGAQQISQDDQSPEA